MLLRPRRLALTPAPIPRRPNSPARHQSRARHVEGFGVPGVVREDRRNVKVLPVVGDGGQMELRAELA